MTPCVATRRNIDRNQNRVVSPLLSPRARPEKTRVVATVATPPLDPAHIALLIEQLREEGALLQHQENTLLAKTASSCSAAMDRGQ